MSGKALTRRSALVLPLALGGCSLWDKWFGENKKPLPGKREPVLGATHGLSVDESAGKVVLPQAVRNAAWPQAGGNPAHLMGHLAANERLAQAWTADIGSGGGYRQKIMAQPVVAEGVVYTMDSNAVVSAFDLATGRRRWRLDTRAKDDDSTNIGGGLAVDQGILYAVNGLAELVAIDAVSGAIKWRTVLGAPARSAPTVAEGRLFVTTIEDRLLARATDDGRELWTHQATNAVTAVLGQPAPAYADGLVVAGFGSGELVCLRAESGNVVWSDNLGAAGGRAASVADFSSIRGLPVISNGRVFATGTGGLTLSLDLPTGRRLWEREVASVASPWVAGDWVFLVSLEQQIAALNANDGRVAWITDLPRWEDPEKQKDSFTWFSPVMVEDRIVVAGTSEEALSISPYTGDILGRQKLSGQSAPVGPIVADGTLLLVSEDARLLALR